MDDTRFSISPYNFLLERRKIFDFWKIGCFALRKEICIAFLKCCFRPPRYIKAKILQKIERLLQNLEVQQQVTSTISCKTPSNRVLFDGIWLAKSICNSKYELPSKKHFPLRPKFHFT